MKSRVAFCILVSLALAIFYGSDVSARGSGGGNRSVFVRNYTRSDGTHVRSHYRSAPGTAHQTPKYSGSSFGYNHPTPKEDAASIPPATITPQPAQPPPEPWFNSNPSLTAKLYKWQHPWFKTLFSSATPPPWPYRILSETDGIAIVVVAPPNSEEAKATSDPTKSNAPADPSPQLNPPPSSRHQQKSSQNEQREPKDIQTRNMEVINALVRQEPLYQAGSLGGSKRYSEPTYSYSRPLVLHEGYRDPVPNNQYSAGYKPVYVNDYYRQDGTHVNSYQRSLPSR